jgi:hypothetical protein
MLSRAVGGALVMVLTSAHAFGQERTIQNLKDVPQRQRVEAVTYCRGAYHVTLGDGSVLAFKQYDLAFKIDTSTNGPDLTKPVLVPTGRVGDRAFVVFATLDELRTAIRAECRS